MTTIPSYVVYDGDGSTTDFTYPFTVLDTDYIVVKVDGVAVSFTVPTPGTARCDVAPAAGSSNVRVERYTPSNSPLVSWSPGVAIRGAQLNKSIRQPLMVAEEARDLATAAMAAAEAGGGEATNASNLTSGTLPNGRLQSRLQEYGETITDWNDAVESGFYQAQGTAANSPAPFFHAGHVVGVSANGCSQTAWRNTGGEEDTLAWRRTKVSGVWGSWYRMRLSQAEMDALYAAAAHTHDDRYYTESEVDTALAGKASSTHDHDSRYYTETEVDAALAGKSDTGHTHDSRYYTETEIDAALAGKADTSHGTHVPAGGTTGQVLKKNSGTDYDVGWAADSTGGGGGGSGDMEAATYDPNGVAADAFDQDNMVDGTTNKNYTATEQTKLAGIEAAADVTDAANVAAAGAFMKASDTSDALTEGASKLLMTTSERSKLAAIEASADVTDAGNVGSSIHGATGKTTPVDADTVPLIDSAASNVLKKVTWANVKATLKTYFDTLYQPLAAALTSWAGVTRASGFDTFAATPSSANLRALLTDEVGTGVAYFVGGALGTPASGTGTNLTGIPQSGVTNLTTDLAAKAPLASPALTGTPTAPTAAADTNSTQVATTAYVQGELTDRVPTSRTVSAAGLATGGGDLSANRTITVPAENAAGFRTGTATDEALTAGGVWDAGAIVTLTDAATISVDMATFINAAVTLGGNRTLGAPSNPKVGQSGTIYVIQDGTGSRTLAFNSVWKFAGGVAPTVTPAAGAVTTLHYKVRTSTFIEIVAGLDVK